MQRKKTTGDDNLPVDLLKKLGDRWMKIMTALINKIYMSGDWPKDFLDIKMIALPKKYWVNKCCERTISFILHTEKIVAIILS